MRQQDIHVFRHHAVPHVAYIRVLKRPVPKARRPRRANHVHSLPTRKPQPLRRIIQVHDIPPIEVAPRRALLLADAIRRARHKRRVEEQVVVARDDDLVSVRQRVEPGELRLQLGKGAADAEVPGVHEDVARRHGGLRVVSVGDAHDGEGTLWVGRAPRERPVAVEVLRDEQRRVLAEALPGRLLRRAPRWQRATDGRSHGLEATKKG